MQNSRDKGPQEPEQEPQDREPTTVESIQQARLDLEARVKAAQTKKEEDIHKKLSDREKLIAEIGDNLGPLLMEARSTLDYYETIDQQGYLADEKDKAELERLRKLVKDFEEKKQTAVNKYEEITINPAVYERVLAEALKENEKREFKKQYQEATKDLESDAKLIFEQMKPIAEERQRLHEATKRQEGLLSQAGVNLDKICVAATENLGAGQANLRMEITHTYQYRTYREYLARLEQVRQGLGMFKGKEKAAIDSVLRQGEQFLAADEIRDLLGRFKGQLDEQDTMLGNLSEQYKAMIAKAWQRQNAIKSRFPESAFSHLPHAAMSNVEDLIKEFGGIKRWKAGEQVGRHEGSRDIEDKHLSKQVEALYSVYGQIFEKAGGYYTVYTPPEKRKA